MNWVVLGDVSCHISSSISSIEVEFQSSYLKAASNGYELESFEFKIVPFWSISDFNFDNPIKFCDAIKSIH